MLGERGTQSQSVILAQLGNKVQFMYEVAFARQELEGLGAITETKLDDTVSFEIKPPYDIDLLVRRLAHFDRIGTAQTQYSRIIARNQKRSDNQYLTHWYYPYKGKYHPRLVRSIFNIIGLEFGRTVLDPFVGSGTTTLEAHLFGINSIGVDISPVCQIVSKVKITSGDVAKELPLFRKLAITAMQEDFQKFARTSSNRGQKDKATFSYRDFLLSIEDERIRDFYMLASLIFASDLGRRRRDFTSFEKNLNTMITSAVDLAKTKNELRNEGILGDAAIELGDARELKSIESESVDAIITSPPYSIALDYTRNDRHALAELGVDVAELSDKCIGVKGKGRNKLDQYDEDMKRCFDEMHRVLRIGCKCVVVIGEATVDGECTRNVENAKEYCEGIGFTLSRELPKKIFGLYNTINDERVLFFQKR